MVFLFNNPVIAFVLLVAIGLTIYFIKKIVTEITLNNDLRVKHQAMRVNKGNASMTKRVGILGAQALAPALILVIAFTIGANLEVNPEATNEFGVVSSSSDVIKLYEDFQEKYTNNYYDFFRGDVMFDGVPEAAVDDTNDLDGETGSDDYSGTNNQVVGVDEMDNVVTDGKYIYAIYGNELTITLAYTMENGIDVLSLEKTITYETGACNEDQFYPMGIYVDEDQLVVVGNEYKYYCYDPENGYGDEEPYMDYYYWGGYSSHVKVLTYDKVDFEVQDEYVMNGYFTGTRKIDNTLYMIINNYIPFYLEDLNVDDYLPYIEINGEKQVTEYDDIVYLEGTDPNAFTSFYAIDLENAEAQSEVVLGNNGFNLYVSENNIYLVGGVYYFWPLAELIDVEEPVQEYRTAIMRVSIDGNDIAFNGVGYVEGYTLNQFSMDEHEGKLRITTTEGWWGEDINNRLYVLDEDLEILSVVEHLGKVGETIRSTRFVGDYAYLVTFEQTDPFYTINLSDPENPVIEDELEIPGFSTYLQPINENLMLGIGFDADLEGRITGLKISIYDISDKSNVTVFDEVVFNYEDFGWSYSSATYNHKDLLVSVSKGIIALPFSTYDWSDEEGYTYNSGILVYNLDLETGLSFNGFVEHEQNSNYNIYVYKAKFIDNYFYTVSNKYIKVSTIADTETILDTVQLRDVESNYYDEVAVEEDTVD
jgi:uncharacterized secreted protein with C-terminal beta-propeller domain